MDIHIDKQRLPYTKEQMDSSIRLSEALSQLAEDNKRFEKLAEILNFGNTAKLKIQMCEALRLIQSNKYKDTSSFVIRYDNGEHPIPAAMRFVILLQ